MADEVIVGGTMMGTNQISDFLSLIVLGCLYWYVVGEIYKDGYRDGKEKTK